MKLVRFSISEFFLIILIGCSTVPVMSAEVAINQKQSPVKLENNPARKVVEVKLDAAIKARMAQFQLSKKSEQEVKVEHGQKYPSVDEIWNDLEISASSSIEK